MSTLPDAIEQNPACGCCGDETRHDGHGGGEPEDVFVSDRLGEPSITISGTVSIYLDEARRLAAALLAAADAAEREQ